jgi:electron transfer flavoprotein beta subunit
MSALNCLVCISHVPDTTTKIKYNAEGNGLDKTGVTFVINPYDEFGLVRAVELQEAAGGQGKVTAICIGNAEVEPTLRKALSIGANDAVRIDAEPLDAFYVASQIAAYAKDKNYDIIFFGKESIDNNSSAVPGMVAELLGLSFISYATKLTAENGKAIIHREVDGGYEVLESSFPLAVSCQKGMAEWRIPNMRGIMAARTKPLAVVAPAAVEPAVTTMRFDLPPAKVGCTYVEAAEAEKLVEILHNKGLI